jgi:hypothetical protein
MTLLIKFSTEMYKHWPVSWYRDTSQFMWSNGIEVSPPSIASKPPSKIPDWQSVQEERIPGARFLEHRKKQWASFSQLTSVAFPGLGEVGVLHWLDACLFSGSYPYHQLSLASDFLRMFGSLSVWFFNPGTKSYSQSDTTFWTSVHFQKPACFSVRKCNTSHHTPFLEHSSYMAITNSTVLQYSELNWTELCADSLMTKISNHYLCSHNTNGPTVTVHGAT